MTFLGMYLHFFCLRLYMVYKYTVNKAGMNYFFQAINQNIRQMLSFVSKGVSIFFCYKKFLATYWIDLPKIIYLYLSLLDLPILSSQKSCKGSFYSLPNMIFWSFSKEFSNILPKIELKLWRPKYDNNLIFDLCFS